MVLQGVIGLLAALAARGADVPVPKEQAGRGLSLDRDDECGTAGAEACSVGLLQRAAWRRAPAGAQRPASQGPVRGAPGAELAQLDGRGRASAPAALAAELVSAVYTYGAPATHAQPFQNLASPTHCFAGLRSYTEDILGKRGKVHQVDAAAMNNFYPHAFTNTVVLHKQRDSYYAPCNAKDSGKPEWPQRGDSVFEEWRLHHEESYTDRLNQLTVDGRNAVDAEPFLSARKYVTLAFRSYDSISKTKIAVHAQFPDMRLVAKEIDKHSTDEDPVMIVQNTTSLDCALVFTGTNDILELFTSTTNYGTGYCGFDKVHVGYRNEMWTISKHIFPRLMPKLEQCDQVTCVGHSLGGALCEIFSACANSGHTSDPDYQLIAWDPNKSPALMPEIAG